MKRERERESVFGKCKEEMKMMTMTRLVMMTRKNEERKKYIHTKTRGRESS